MNLNWTKVALVLGALTIGASVTIFAGGEIGGQWMAATWAIIGGVIGGVVVPSSGVKRAPTIFIGAATIVMMSMAAGCNPLTTASITDTEISSGQQPQNQAVMDIEGNQRAQYIGISPTQLKQDATGSWLTTPGMGAVLTFVDPTSGGTYYIWSPKDVSIGSLTLPGGLTVNNLQANASTVITAWNEQVVAYLQTLAAMSVDQKLAEIERAKAAGEITASVADAAASIVRVFSPVP